MEPSGRMGQFRGAKDSSNPVKELQNLRSRKNFVLSQEYPSLDLAGSVECSGGSWGALPTLLQHLPTSPFWQLVVISETTRQNP